MGQVLPLPYRGEVFVDLRGEGRTLRISGHPDAATVVLSIWEHNQCRATFRLAANQVDALVRAILAAAPPAAPQPWLALPMAPSTDAANDAVEPPPEPSPLAHPVDDPTSTHPVDDPMTTHPAADIAVVGPDRVAGADGVHPSPDRVVGVDGVHPTSPAAPRDQAG